MTMEEQSMKKSFGKKFLAGIISASMILGIPSVGYSQEEDAALITAYEEETGESAAAQTVLAGAVDTEQTVEAPAQEEAAAVETPAQTDAAVEEAPAQTDAEVQAPEETFDDGQAPEEEITFEETAEDALAEEDIIVAAEEEAEEDVLDDGILLEAAEEEDAELQAAEETIDVATFPELRENINTASNGTVINVTANITFTEALSFEKGATTLTIKLNGKTLTLADDAAKPFSVKSGRTLIIEKGTIETKKAMLAADGGTLTLSEGVTVKGEGDECVLVGNGGTANVYGEINSTTGATKGFVIGKGKLNLDGVVKTLSTGIELIDKDADVQMAGGSIETSGIGVDVLKGSMTMKDGTIVSTGSKGVDLGYNSSKEAPASFSILKGEIQSKENAIVVYKKGALTVSGSKNGDTYSTRIISSDGNAIYEATGDYDSSIKIAGGYFEGKTEEFTCAHNQNIVTVTSDAVGFAHEVEREYLKDVNCRADKTVKVGGKDVYVIRVLTASNSAAAYIRDGKTFYTDTVQEAMTELPSKDYSPKTGDTVKLMKDINTTADKEILVEMGRTIDLNQHKLYTKMTVKGCTVTIKNGTLQAYTDDTALVVDAGANVTLDSNLTVSSPGDEAIHVGDDASATYSLTVKGPVTGKYFAVFVEKGKSTVKFDSAKLTATDSYQGSVVRTSSEAKDAVITINKTTITGAQGVLILAGACTITDSTITGKGDQKGDPSPGTTNNGSAVAIGSKAKVTITSGTFTSEKGHALYIDVDTSGNVVSGGTFRSKRANWDAVSGKKSANMISGGNFSPNKTNVMKDSVDTSKSALVGVTDGIFYAAAYDKVMSTLYAANASATKLTVGAAAAGKTVTGCKAHASFLNKSGADVTLLVGTDATVAKNKGTLPSSATTKAWILHNDLVKLTKIANKAATCTLPAVSADCWYCTTLKKTYSDQGQTEKNVITAAAKGHKWSAWDTNGDRKCTVCGAKEHDASKKAAAPAPAKYKIPSYPRNLKLASKKTRKLTVSWRKPTKTQLKKITGIQIQIATDKNFKKIVKTKKVKKTKTSVTFTLKKKKKYYVRLRYYKGSQYSKWCATKNKKTK